MANINRRVVLLTAMNTLAMAVNNEEIEEYWIQATGLDECSDTDDIKNVVQTDWDYATETFFNAMQMASNDGGFCA